MVATFSVFSAAPMPRQDVAFELYYDGAWRSVTADNEVFTSEPIRIQRGQADQSPAPRPAQISAQLDNAADKYRTSNPVSVLYGKAGRNTPARVAVSDVVRGVVEASSWSNDQTDDFRRIPKRGKAWTDVQGGGLLQRIGQWTEPLKSAFRTYNESLSHVTAYFPCEQVSTTLAPEATFSGPQGFAFSGGVEFDSQSYPPSSAPLMDINENGGPNLYTGVIPSATSTAGWQHSWVSRLEPLPNADTYFYSWNTSGGGESGDAFQLTILPTTGEIQLQGSNSAVAPGFWLDVTKTTDDYDFTQWTMWTVDATYSGGTTTLFVNWTNADNTESRFMSGTFAHEPGSLDSSATSASTANGEVPEGSTFGHFLFVDVGSDGGVDLFGTDRISAWTGHLGERTAYRFARLLSQAGITDFESTNYDESMPMGPQRVATLAEHLEEIQQTEDGLIFDLGSQAAVFLLCRFDRYNQTAALTLVPEEMPGLPREVTDDLRTHNVVTAVDRQGLEATAEDSTSALGTQAPPDGAGEYKQRIDVSVSFPRTRLPDIANWWMRRGTVDLPRFPKVAVNLAALAPARVAAVEAVEIGSVIEITDFREDTIRLYVLGYDEIIGTHSRRIVFTCAPDQQFQVAVYDDTSKRMESRTSTLNATVDSDATSLVVTFSRIRDAWSETAEPYDWGIAGERITVTSMGAVTGSGPWTQTATVKRSVNGVRKRLTAGEPIHMFPSVQARYAL